MTAKVLVIGLDAVESTILDRLIAEGRAPTLAGLAARGSSSVLRAECMDTLPGAIWQDVATGQESHRHGDYYPIRLHTGEQVIRSIEPTMHADRYYWTAAARAGRRVAIVDQPLVPVLPTVPEVTQIAEWHVHDQLWGSGSNPPGLFAELESRFGRQPIDRCDFAHRGTLDGYVSWTEELRRQLTTKTAMVEDLLAHEAWDLFSVAFGEGHCAGHQLWHLHDETWWSHPADCPERHRGLLDEVYVALDTALGRVIGAAGDDATVLVFTSHGMGPYVGGPQLLGDVLRALGLGDNRRLPSWLRPLVPITVAQRAFGRLPAIRRVAAGSRIQDRGFIRAGVRAMPVPNNRVGGIRLNVVGREPEGEIDPADVDAVMTEITAELEQLRLRNSDVLVVDRVIRTADRFGPQRHPDLPDLLVVFRRDVGEIGAVVGPRVGELRRALQRPDLARTGDHTDRSKLWCAGPAFDGAPDVVERSNLDIAPTILDLLSVQAPAHMSGRSIIDGE